MTFKTRLLMLPAAAGLVFLLTLAGTMFLGSQLGQSIVYFRTIGEPMEEALAQMDRSLERFELNQRAGQAAEAQEAWSQALKVAGNVGKLQDRAELAKALEQQLQAGPGADAATAAAVIKEVRALMAQATATVNKESDFSKDRIEGATKGLLMGGLASGALTLLLLGVLTWGTLRDVSRTLGADPKVLLERARRVASGDLGSGESQAGTPGSLSAELDRMAAQLSETVLTIRQSAESVTVASREIAAGNTDLSERTERTASNLQMASASMSGMADDARGSAEAAQQAKTLAHQAIGSVETGQNTMREAVSSMAQISQASNSIGTIVSVINDIAFQTNILALNAAVEAARAGESGRGFAVVASEVRSLAQRCATAAQEIRNIVATSSACVERGAKHVKDAGHVMVEIEAGMHRLDELVAGICASTGSQVHGIVDVVGTVRHVDDMTQQNSALVEQSAAAAQSLHDNAQRLRDTVAGFKLHATHEQLAPV